MSEVEAEPDVRSPTVPGARLGGEARRPGLVGGIDVSGGLDTDGDGRPDTAVLADGPDLVLCTDLDGDALADQVLHIGPDGSLWEEVWEEVVLAVDRLLGAEGG